MQQIPVIGQAWRSSWEYVIPFMAFEPEVRRVVYTTNAIEALNRQLRKAIKTKGSFPTEDAARKLIYLAIQNAVPAMDANPGVDESAPSVQDPIRRPTPQLTIKHRLHRKSDALGRRQGIALSVISPAGPAALLGLQGRLHAIRRLEGASAAATGSRPLVT